MTRTLLDYRAAYEGRVAILLGGASVREQDLSRVRCPILGTNQSWRGLSWPRAVAHVLSDWRTALDYGAHVVSSWPSMPVFQKAFDVRYVLPGTIPLWKRDGEGFRFDLEHGAWTMGAPVLALQLAVYMGFSEIVLLGLDLKMRGANVHWWDAAPMGAILESQAAANWALQAAALITCAEAIATHPRGVRVVNVSHDSACDAFTRRPFDEVFA
jgi:hypothetical protein